MNFSLGSTTEKWSGIRVALEYRPVCPQPIERIRQATADVLARARSGSRPGSGHRHVTGGGGGNDPDASLMWSWTVNEAARVNRLLPFVERQEEECLNLNVYVPVVGESI